MYISYIISVKTFNNYVKTLSPTNTKMKNEIILTIKTKYKQ